MFGLSSVGFKDGDDPLITQVVGDAQSSVLTAAVCIGAGYDCSIEKRQFDKERVILLVICFVVWFLEYFHYHFVWLPNIITKNHEKFV